MRSARVRAGLKGIGWLSLLEKVSFNDQQRSERPHFPEYKGVGGYALTFRLLELYGFLELSHIGFGWDNDMKHSRFGSEETPERIDGC